MTITDNLSVPKLLDVPSPTAVVAPDVRKEYASFLQQLKTVADGNVVLSNPYFFLVKMEGILDSLKDWIQNLTPAAKLKLLLLSAVCRPFDPSKVWRHNHPRLIDDPVFRIVWGTTNVSLAESATGIPWGLDVLQERRKALGDPGIKQLIDAIPFKSSIETLTSEFMGEQPGNFGYQAWQVADWSREWAVVYGITDAAHDEGYPFPWLLGFCRRDRLERNFVVLLREGANRFDVGFYSTYGKISGRWRLAKRALASD